MNGTFQVFCVKQVNLTGVRMLMSINQRFACVRQACISFNKHGCKMHYFVISGARDLTKWVLRRSGYVGGGMILFFYTNGSSNWHV